MSINPDNGYLIDPVYKNITINKNNSVIKKIEEFRYSLFLEEQALRLIQKECIFKTNGLI